MAATVLFAEAGHHGGSVNRLRLLLDSLETTEVRPVVLSHFSDGRAGRLLSGPGLLPRFTLGVTGDAAAEPLAAAGPLIWPTVSGMRQFALALRVIRAQRPRLVYVNNTPFSHLPLLLACRMLRVPYVCHLRDTVRLTRAERWALRRAWRVIVLSRAARDHYAAQGVPSETTDVIYDGISLAAFDHQRRSALREPPPGRTVIGLVGSLVPRKRPADAVALVHRLVPEFPQLLLVLFGDGPERARLEQDVRRHGLEDHVRIHGWTENVAAELGACHLGLLTSEREGMPNVVLEYMAAALPVVTTDLPGIREMVDDGESGFVVPVGDAAALDRSVRLLLTQPDMRRRMGCRGRQALESGRFTLIAEHQAILGLLLDRPAPSGS